MPLNDKKIIDIITAECESVEERCEGYREEIAHTLADIVMAEMQNRTQGINIQQKVKDACNTAGQYLVRKRGGESC